VEDRSRENRRDERSMNTLSRERQMMRQEIATARASGLHTRAAELQRQHDAFGSLLWIIEKRIQERGES
jgi:hypothetical protein